MVDIEQGQVWEMYSVTEDRWVSLHVTKVEGSTVILRYEGVLEFVTVDIADLENKPDVFRKAGTE